ncbi:bifunctional 4-hydroxy-2-oxoglutarate aldolase/2-dehydro-3-deoxy-phosphogluconate aldolase [Arthrobacter sp. Marseille-P9274]|uniref:bifunctional 4-hydroxy-2-oxoglutarate aldolase/2-dehydro-3-deoxy-phosphogluconate aldolase n=1 Tax=Arthrobacter sp. Marseille-P9274 TaxID=2866572 RepID=UPI0021C6AF97|nr:bifunctional 4-hydroxy-2-oxoglutarate aldolase/2-dehydro-3-deoxy-phosphogluconate aldolase [Arthrobacter sp. Marseille-P9274]
MMTTAPTAEQVAECIGAARLLPVLRTRSAEEAHGLAMRLLSLGLTSVELTTTTPGWQQVVASVRAEAPEALVGVGTIGSVSDAEAAVSAGAHFLVSPYPVPGARQAAQEQGTLFIEGSFTPGELAAASSRGVTKLFPAHVGGVSYLKSMLAVLPGARIIPTGGIPLAEVSAWLNAGAYAVGVGSDLYSGGDLDGKVQALLSSLEARP